MSDHVDDGGRQAMGRNMNAEQSMPSPDMVDGVEQRYRELEEGEGGRFYCTKPGNTYHFPLDENALDSMDIWHKVIGMARPNGVLHTRPLAANPDLRVLDLGCGTGIWAIDVSEQLLARQRNGEIPEGGFKVIGLDLALLQPRRIPTHLDFSKVDIENDARWGVHRDRGNSFESFQDNSFDLIGVRMLMGSIKNWQAIYDKIYRHLKPGIGEFEQVEIDWTPRCDDNTLPADSILHFWSNHLHTAMERAEQPIGVDVPSIRSKLQRAGFPDVAVQEIKLPYNGWPTEPEERRQLGRWVNLALTQTVDGLTMAPMSRFLQKPEEQIRALVSKVTYDSCIRRQHGYFRLYVFNARRPQNP